MDGRRLTRRSVAMNGTESTLRLSAAIATAPPVLAHGASPKSRQTLTLGSLRYTRGVARPAQDRCRWRRLSSETDSSERTGPFLKP